MGNTDVVTKNYMRQNTVFADACNYLIYGGRNIVDPEKLTELDPTELGVLFETDSSVRDMDKPETIQKYRDVLKSAVIMQDDRAAYLIIGIENQTDIHYAMPVRNMIYDALQYGKQVDETSRKNQKEKMKKPRNRGEYLSGFYKEDKLIPVITFVIHFGAYEWDGPMSIKEMMDPQDETLLDSFDRSGSTDGGRTWEVQEQFTGNIELCEIFERQRKTERVFTCQFTNPGSGYFCKFGFEKYYRTANEYENRKGEI